eukprot:TRINITY_DN4083_c0_g1_i2.p1 TRINITY_DN4083_c0_g1~~TRINITY_DN4083_c0_g1_i2.p1  ORF type:complete len:149 (+),score=29.48 TRINITY_DN4083_c0_g1_i2:636-1082(+)
MDSDGKLSTEVENEYREGFKLFDQKNQGSIPKEDLGTVMRSLGLNPTNAELSEMLKDIEGEQIVFYEFLTMMNKQRSNEDTKDDIKASFTIFDKNNNGVVSVQELRHVLTTVGEKLSEDEFDEIIKDAEVDKNGMINCEDFINMLTSK